METYLVRKARLLPELKGLWDGPAWKRANVLTIGHFRVEGSEHHPFTRVKILYDNLTVYGIFIVEDRFVRCLRTDYMSEVWKDSCVEWFVQPKAGRGYFNFEFNCGGALYCSYIEDPTRTAYLFKKFTPLPEGLGKKIRIFHSLSPPIDPEIAVRVEWTIEFQVPISVFEPFVGTLKNLEGQEWRANFNKCGDETSHPHWGTWSPLGEREFHRPQDFGTIRFGPPKSFGLHYRQPPRS
jgi:hypothetical protein